MENQNEFPKMLLKEKDRHVVVLSQDLGEYEEMTELRVEMKPRHANLIRFRENGKTKSHRYSADEMDAICAAWFDFRFAQWQAERDAEQRLEEVKTEALSIAKECPAIHIEDKERSDGLPAWIVTVPACGWNNHECWSYNEDDLLFHVKQAKEAYDEHARIQAEVEKAHALTGKIPGLEIRGDGAPWYCLLINGTPIHSTIRPDELLAYTKQHIVKSIYQLASNYPITIVKLEPDQVNNEGKCAWEVVLNGSNHRYIAYKVSQLLEYVQECVKIHEKQAATVN